jgi:hypothetical protein
MFQRVLDRLSLVGRGLIYTEFMVAMLAIAYLGLHLFPIVFGLSPAAIPIELDGLCTALDSRVDCATSVFELAPGRMRVVTNVSATEVRLRVRRGATRGATALLLRMSAPAGDVRVTATGADGSVIRTATVEQFGRRMVISLPAESTTSGVAVSMARNGAATTAPAVIDEVGFYLQPTGLLADARAVFPFIPPDLYYGIVIARGVLPIGIFVCVAALFIPAQALKVIAPISAGVICMAFCLLDLMILNSPFASGDLRLFYVAGPLQEGAGSNLNGGLWIGIRLLTGQGLTILPNVVPWARMPGYGFFCALAGVLFGHRTFLDIAMSTVLLQIIFYSGAVAILTAAAAQIWPPAVALVLGVIISFLPKQVGYTQVDSVIAPIAMLTLSALCVRLKEPQDVSRRRWRPDVAVHLTFALWFFFRPDVLPGWAMVSLMLHWGEWRRLAVPAVLVGTIGLTWGMYKFRYTHEFSPTTSSVGPAFICGLWEVPNRIATTCTDEDYFSWIQSNTTFEPKTQAASVFATREVVRFWLTFPGHVVIMLTHKMLKGLDGDYWPGLRTDLQRGIDAQRTASRILERPVATLLLLSSIATALAVGYHSRRTLLLGWPIFFNAPLFWLTFSSSGRFYSAVSVALIVVAIPPLFDAQFYTRIWEHRWWSAAALAFMLLFAITAWPLHQWLLGNDAFHYWAPFLDPAHSTLTHFKQ